MQYTEEEHPIIESIKISSDVLISLREKIDVCKSTSNHLKAKIKYRDSQINNIKDRLKKKLSKEQYTMIEPEINDIPAN